MTYKGVITSIQLADDNQAFIISFYFVMNFFKKKKTNKHIHIQKMLYVLFSDSLKRCQGWAAGVFAVWTQKAVRRAMEQKFESRAVYFAEKTWAQNKVKHTGV